MHPFIPPNWSIQQTQFLQFRWTSAHRPEQAPTHEGLGPDTRPPCAVTDPLFVRIARALEEDIRRGRLPPGAPLPGSRTLAKSLGVHRNTVLAAYQELATQGWVITSAARATSVSPTLPDMPARSTTGVPRGAMPSRVGFPSPPPPPFAVSASRHRAARSSWREASPTSGSSPPPPSRAPTAGR
ncbi:GntR family transcriptional regulator [Cystobacter fuscus]